MSELNSRFYIFFDSLVKSKIVKDRADFANKSNISVSMLTEIAKDRTQVGLKIIQNSVRNFNLNPTWLLTGEGEMFLATTKPYKQRDRESIVREEPAKYVSSQGIPLIPIDAMAGIGTGDVSILDLECERYVVPEFNRADYLIRIAGSSMYPKYNSGDIVACKRLPLNDLFFQWNKVYVLDTIQGAIIKRVHPGRDDDHIELISENEKYKPVQLHISKINAIALVIGVIRLE